MLPFLAQFITAFSFVVIGVGLILGPFFAGSDLFRETAQLFWAWVNFTVMKLAGDFHKYKA